MIIKLISSATSFGVPLPFCSGTNNLNFSPAGGPEKKRHKQACSFKFNFGISSLSEKKKNKKEIVRASPPTEIISQLLLPIISTVSTATEEKWELDNGKPGIVEPSGGRLLQGGLVFQQNFTIRSFEIGSDFRLSIETLMNYLQETSLNHLKTAGILADGFGSTLAMTAKDLIWVVCWSHVEVDYYPSWGDVVQVDAWMYRSGRNGIRRDWLIQDLKTGKTLIRATSLFAMMNKKTRKFAKASEEVIAEMKPFLMHCDPLINKDTRKLLQVETDTADYIRTGLNPGWTDMDVNQHVNHIKLVNYVLEGVPPSIVESHELCAMTLEYRKECSLDSVLQSLSKLNRNQLIYDQEIEFEHSLSLECRLEIVRGRSRWRKKLCVINT
ncbi:hypothetical protein Pint_29920 [Pistacia integerrima]|uniref:Uncharacterized protein n=1 Tax=Pistacia integerrima TaxID=434235 RepID=A0ACC0WZQ5_9ROSI|nr:hypothetical protein Pint_29920 [Pistacia integerrima]